MWTKLSWTLLRDDIVRCHDDMKTRGFTLIELLVVIAIIGLLASVVLASLTSARTKARDAKRMADLHSMQTALELYYNANGSYPHIPGSCGGSTSDMWSSWDGATCWQLILSSQYISSVPTDPVNTDLGNCGIVANCHIYHYCVWNNWQNYAVAVNLENAPSRTYGSNANCPTGGPNNYWMSN